MAMILGTITGGSSQYLTLSCDKCGTSALKRPISIYDQTKFEEVAQMAVDHQCNPLLVDFKEGRDRKAYNQGYTDGGKHAYRRLIEDITDVLEQHKPD